MVAHIMTDLPPRLADGRRQLRSYAYAGVLQTCIRPVVGENVKDDSSDHIIFFHLSPGLRYMYAVMTLDTVPLETLKSWDVPVKLAPARRAPRIWCV
ncbi:hypothetical protein TNCV_2661831 [Trichonephila clavipes]|nr:hypothetical protein TNCV_2661831 [Trichonephila clavipes]